MENKILNNPNILFFIMHPPVCKLIILLNKLFGLEKKDQNIAEKELFFHILLIFGRSRSGKLFKYLREIIGIIVSAKETDFADCSVGKLKLQFGFVYSHLLKISHACHGNLIIECII